MAPLRHGLDTKATVFTWSITTDIRANLLSARFSKRAPAATGILFSACCRDHDDTGATELTDRICRVRRPVDIPAPPRRAGGSPESPIGGEMSKRFVADSPVEGTGFEPSVSIPRLSSI